jgi:hypothetical protein
VAIADCGNALTPREATTALTRAVFFIKAELLNILISNTPPAKPALLVHNGNRGCDYLAVHYKTWQQFPAAVPVFKI